MDKRRETRGKTEFSHSPSADSLLIIPGEEDTMKGVQMQQKEIHLISGFPQFNGFKKLSSLESMAMRARAWLRVSSLFPSSLFSAPSPLADIRVSNLIPGFCVCVCVFSICLWVPQEWACMIHLWVSVTQAWLQTYVKRPENLAQSFPSKFTVWGHLECGEVFTYDSWEQSIQSRHGGGGYRRGTERWDQGPRRSSREERTKSEIRCWELGQAWKQSPPWVQAAARWDCWEWLCVWFRGDLRERGWWRGHIHGPFFSQVGKRERNYSSLTLGKNPMLFPSSDFTPTL